MRPGSKIKRCGAPGPTPVPPSHYGMSETHPAETLVTVTFAEHEGKTKLTPRQSVPESVEEREGTQLGWIEMLDRLGGDLPAVRPGRVSS
jgi:Activator of Hsp90 ATPase homolog 1-like protein